MPPAVDSSFQRTKCQIRSDQEERTCHIISHVPIYAGSGTYQLKEGLGGVKNECVECAASAVKLPTAISLSLKAAARGHCDQRERQSPVGSTSDASSDEIHRQPAYLVFAVAEE